MCRLKELLTWFTTRSIYGLNLPHTTLRRIGRRATIPEPADILFITSLVAFEVAAAAARYLHGRSVKVAAFYTIAGAAAVARIAANVIDDDDDDIVNFRASRKYTKFMHRAAILATVMKSAYD